jgi:hypothetical protein
MKMHSFPRLALAVVLMGATTLPVLAQAPADHATPAPRTHALHAAVATEAPKTGAAAKPADKPAAVTDKGTAVPATPEVKPGATTATPPATRTN